MHLTDSARYASIYSLAYNIVSLVSRQRLLPWGYSRREYQAEARPNRVYVRITSAHYSVNFVYYY